MAGEDEEPYAQLMVHRAEHKGFPRLEIAPGVTILSGQDAWEQYAFSHPPAGEYHTVMARLAELPDGGPDTEMMT
jgi:hypothetical protein